MLLKIAEKRYHIVSWNTTAVQMCDSTTECSRKSVERSTRGAQGENKSKATAVALSRNTQTCWCWHHKMIIHQIIYWWTTEHKLLFFGLTMAELHRNTSGQGTVTSAQTFYLR